MLGSYDLVLRNKKVCYRLNIKRKFTVIRGNSATGKSTFAKLVDMQGDKNGVFLSCKLNVVVLNDGNYKLLLSSASGCIFVIDETFQQLGKCGFNNEFSGMVKNSDNYFIVITRKKLSDIPYSLQEIYYLNTSNSYVLDYKFDTRLMNAYLEDNDIFVPDVILTEDSNSGFQFFRNIFNNVVSAEGKSKVCTSVLNLSSKYTNIAVIVDGAAFGSEIDELMRVFYSLKVNAVVFAPESFEYLLLRCMNNVKMDMLDKTYDYCDAKRFNSWEQFYTWYISDITRASDSDKRREYVKSELRPYFMRYKLGVLKQLNGLQLDI